MNAWVVRLLNASSALLALLAGLAFGGVLPDGLGPVALAGALVGSGTALVLRVIQPSQARWQALYIGLTLVFLAAALITWAIDPPDIGSEDCGFIGPDGEEARCGGKYSYVAVVIMPATLLAFTFAWLSVSETPTPRA